MKRLFIMILFALVLAGCKTDSGIPEISAKDIFSIEAKEYYVLFVKADCAGCEKIKPDAVKYHNLTILNPKMPKIYTVDVGNEANKEIIGDTDIIDGTTSVAQLRITRTPTLIVIKDGKVSEHHINSSNVGCFFENVSKK